MVRTVKGLVVRMLRSDIEFLVQLSASPLAVLADPAALEQVLINLMTNAQDFTRFTSGKKIANFVGLP